MLLHGVVERFSLLSVENSVKDVYRRKMELGSRASTNARMIETYTFRNHFKLAWLESLVANAHQ